MHHVAGLLEGVQKLGRLACQSHAGTAMAMQPLICNPRLDMIQVSANGEHIPCLGTLALEKS